MKRPGKWFGEDEWQVTFGDKCQIDRRVLSMIPIFQSHADNNED